MAKLKIIRHFFTRKEPMRFSILHQIPFFNMKSNFDFSAEWQNCSEPFSETNHFIIYLHLENSMFQILLSLSLSLDHHLLYSWMIVTFQTYFRCLFYIFKIKIKDFITYYLMLWGFFKISCRGESSNNKLGCNSQ